MALIVCKECNENYSNMAAACPHCGCPTEHNIKNNVDNVVAKRMNKKKLFIIGAVIIGIAVTSIGIYSYQQNLKDKKEIAEQVYSAVSYNLCIDYLFQQTISENTLKEVLEKHEKPTADQIFRYTGFLEDIKHEFIKAENELRVNEINELNTAINLSKDRELISLIEAYQMAIKKQYESNKKTLLDYESIFSKYSIALDHGNYEEMGKYNKQLTLTNDKLLFGENDLENYMARQKLLGYINKHCARVDKKTISDISVKVKDDICNKIKVYDTPEYNAKKAELIKSLKEYPININEGLPTAE